MATLTSSIPHFRITFILGTTNTLTITDLLQDYTAYGTTVEAVFEVLDPDGLVVYQNTGYSSDPPTFTYPDITSTTPTWAVSGIALYLDADGVTAKRGTYTVRGWYRMDAGTPVEVVKTYDLEYVSPVVDIDMTPSCRTSELVVTDNTDYTEIGDDEPYTTTISRSCAVTKPAGSGANAPATTTSTTTTYTRTIGGGSTSATRLWTRIWQTNITTTLQYDMALWDSYYWVVIQDVVLGDEYVDVQCSDCPDVLNTCWENLITRWQEAEENHTVNVNNLRYKVAAVAAKWTDFYNRERNGEDTSDLCIEIRDLLNSEDCSCVGDDDTASAVIVPWGAGAAAVAASTFAFTASTADPTPGSGNATDLHFNKTSKHFWTNVAGTWTDLGSVSGSTGAPGADGVAEPILYNNSSNTGTSAGTALEDLDSYDATGVGAFDTGDMVYAKSVFELATANDNGKSVSLYINATQIALYFTDSSVNSENKFVTVEMWLTVTGTNTQAIETLVTRGGNCYPGYTTGTFNPSAALDIKAKGQNSAATLNDIICRKLLVKYENKVTAV